MNFIFLRWKQQPYNLKKKSRFCESCYNALHGRYLRFQEFTQVHAYGKQAIGVSDKEGLFLTYMWSKLNSLSSTSLSFLSY